jgi:hypothetical protein
MTMSGNAVRVAMLGSRHSALRVGAPFEIEIPVLLIESRCLKIVRVEDHVLTATSTSLLCCGVKQCRPIALATEALMDPERTDITAATPGPSLDPGTNGLLLVSYKYGKPLSIVNPGLLDVVFVKALVQKLHVCMRGMRFDCQRTNIHG